MTIWTFHDYKSPAGANKIAQWYGALSVQEQADFDALLSILGNSSSWRYPDYKTLSGKKLSELGEIRFKSGGKQHRVIGMIWPKESEYSLLIGCTHKGSVYNPANALVTAPSRRDNLKNGTASIVKHED